MANLIESYEIRMVEPGCSVGTGRWGVLVTLPNDISAVFPYLNAVLPKASYDHENKNIIWTEPTQSYALRPYEIRIARVSDPEQARATVSEASRTATTSVWPLPYILVRPAARKTVFASMVQNRAKTPVTDMSDKNAQV